MKAALSFGVRSSYRLEVTAKDGAVPARSGTAYVIITVEDTNDYLPLFNPTTYSKSISEGSTFGTAVLTVLATDQDTGPSGKLSFSIASGNINNAFSISSQTGLYSLPR